MCTQQLTSLPMTNVYTGIADAAMGAAGGPVKAASLAPLHADAHVADVHLLVQRGQ